MATAAQPGGRGLAHGDQLVANRVLRAMYRVEAARARKAKIAKKGVLPAGGPHLEQLKAQVGVLPALRRRVAAVLAPSADHRRKDEPAKLEHVARAEVHLAARVVGSAVPPRGADALLKADPSQLHRVGDPQIPGARQPHRRKSLLRRPDREGIAADHADQWMDARLLRANTHGNGGEPDPPDSPPIPIQDPPAKPQTDPPAPVREPGPTPPPKR